MMKEKVIVFGLGGKLSHEKRYNSQFYKTINIEAFCDNNSSLWGTEYDGKKVIAPADLQQYQFDRVVIASNYFREIVCQLTDAGIDRTKIMHWDEYAVRDMHGQVTTYVPHCMAKGKSVLMITTTLGVNGGTVAVINAAEALTRRGYVVSLCAKQAKGDIVRQITARGVWVILCPSIGFPKEDELRWIEKFDYVMVNVYQMMRCAKYISNYRRVLWWIHECSEKYCDIYPRIQSLFFEYCVERYENINVCAVSNIARRNFLKYHPGQDVNIMTLGVDEQAAAGSEKGRRGEKHIFAVIGAILPRKGQADVLRAVEVLNRSGRQEQCEFWIIGKAEDKPYSEELKEKAAHYPNVKLLGEMSEDRMHILYRQIDTVVCFSYEETMSLTVIEGMMHNKTCIATEQTGIAEYMEDYKNGFICMAGDVGELADKCIWIMTHEEECEVIARNARKTYEQYFTLEQLGQRLEKELRRNDAKTVDLFDIR